MASRSRFVTLKNGSSQHRKYLPLALVGDSAIMTAMVWTGVRITEISIMVMRAFMEMRNLVSSNKDWVSDLESLERKAD